MSKVLIAVGGTGQEIALACLRLCHMAASDVPTVFVIDSDQAGGEGNLQTRSRELQKLGRFLSTSRGIPNPITFLTPLAENIRDRYITNLRSLFSPAQQTPPRVNGLLSLLFTQAQQQTNISDGFHGEPTVGSVAVDDYMRLGNFNEEFLTRLDNLTMADRPHFIVLAGSTTGGTGPGTLPPLSKKILEWRAPRRSERRIEVSGLVQLQWFQPVKVEGVEWSRVPDIDLGRLQRNSACLVRQYDANLATLADRVVLLSLPRVIQRVSAGANHQPETRHYLNILSGWIAMELLHDGRTLTELTLGGLYSYSLDDEDDVLNSLTFPRNGNSVSLKQALAATRILVAFGEALNHQIGKLQPDLALPLATYGFLQMILKHHGRERSQVFLDMFSNFLVDGDRKTLQWFTDACAARVNPDNPSSPRDSNDLKGVFEIPSSEVSTDLVSVGRLLAKPQKLEQDFVSYLLKQAKAGPEEADPEATAVKLYRDLRDILLEKLL